MQKIEFSSASIHYSFFLKNLTLRPKSDIFITSYKYITLHFKGSHYEKLEFTDSRFFEGAIHGGSTFMVFYIQINHTYSFLLDLCVGHGTMDTRKAGKGD